ncbi:MAG: methyl-accepting chemotaxis protein [Azonexus sp.]
MTIARKLAMTVATFLLLIIATGGIALFQLGKVGSVADHIAEQELPSVRFAGAMRAEAIDFRNRETQLLIIRNASEIDETLGRQKKNLDDLKKFENEYEKTALRDEQKTLLREYRKALDIYMKTHDQLVQQVRAGEADKALAYFRGEQRKAFRTLLPTIDKIVEDSASNSDRLRTESIEVRSEARIELIIGILLTAIIGVVIGSMLYRSVVTPLEKVQGAIAQIVETKNFTHPIGISGNDEIARTANAIDSLTSTMRTTLSDFSVVIKELSDMATQLAVSAKHVEASSTEQSDSASTMAATVEEMTVSINQVADNAQSLAEAAEDSDGAATEGRTVMLQTVEQMKNIGGRIEDTSLSIKSLGQASIEITSIVQVIRDVADQTNLLALNAAIEAARAGEQGRGFAVVADEVRKLAERTSLATQEIAGKIEAIRSGTEKAGKQMEISVEQVACGMARANEANSAVDRIKSGFSRVDAEISAISSALKEQGQASNEIAGRIERVAQASEENSRSAEKAAVMSHELAGLAQRLREDIASYKL